ncbi:MAG: DNA polymerase III subunit alpha [Flavobacteriales bacterium]|nr:DNA polymerase III subunit alpha [Flavobacteriales bacterium]
MFLIFDTETTGLPQDYNAPIERTENWPRVVQIAWQIHDIKGKLIEVKNFIIKPVGYSIPYNAEKIHGISTERALKSGVDIEFVFEEFNQAIAHCEFIAGHNIEFDIKVWGAEFVRAGLPIGMLQKKWVDTKDESTEFCAIPGGKGGKFKWPTLTELHQKLFQSGFSEAHNASADVEATTRCFLELIRLNVITPARLGFGNEFLHEFRIENPNPIALIGLNIQPYQPLNSEQKENTEINLFETTSSEDHSELLKDISFSHLHNHSQYSILQSTSEINKLVKKAAQLKMPGIALTDTGNMMAAFEFVKEVFSYNKGVDSRRKEAEAKGESFDEINLKPIVGCEFNICRNHLDKSTKDNGSQVVLLAKNEKGYHNLAKMSSIAFVSGFYYVPRIDKEVLLQYKENLIATTGGLYGEIPNLILNVGEEQAETAFLWWKEQFGEDFYAELLRHGQDEEEKVNEILLKFCHKHGVKYFAANNTYYLNQTDANAHDILLCVKDGEKKETPIGKGRGFRYGFPNDQYYFKSQEEMKSLFADLPEAIITTNEIVAKVEPYKLERNVLLPKFEIPDEFKFPEDDEDGGKRGENAYLKFLTYEGAKKRYTEITPEIQERLDFELATIEKTGYPGYFLIVQDFTTEARKMGVSVGPGRGSAAGSAVAYCIGITNVDPIKYDLLFERFLNPERVSLPDIDIDFDDEGRDKVIDYVVKKYGANQVAQIITYGTMAAKSAIRDTARVLDLPLPDADRIAKLIPDLSLGKILELNETELKEKLSGEDLEMAQQLRKISTGQDLSAQTVQQAKMLEGSLRNTGIHACGVIITPEDITRIVPVATAKDSELYVTQFDNSVVESAGLLKMDFLGLKTLTIIKDACKIIKERHGLDLDPDSFPLDDTKTYELYQRGETNGTFQFESPGMQKYLRELKPDTFADLIAMNALYRPGPLEYIPNFIRRKHGQEPITYDLPEMEEYLKETYGITVYQEQVMLLSQSLADFSKGKADELRKAMGKKIRAKLDELKPLFIENAMKKGHPEDRLNKIWTDWEAFASYAFNKSHSTCYAYVAYQTAYLKAHYPAEYMASVLTHNMSDIKKVTFFMEECRRMKIPVLGPSVNESELKFTVNDSGAIRFGLGAIKGVGENAVEAIVQTRKTEGKYSSIFDFTRRIDLRAANKKTLENLALAGAFDDFGISRSAFFFDEGDNNTFLSKAIKFGSNHQEGLNSAQVSLFGEESSESMPEPSIPRVEPWPTLYQLNREKEVVGIYISGHPLDDFRYDLNQLCTKGFHCGMISLLNKDSLNKELKLAGIITKVEHRQTKTGKPFGSFEIEDYEGNARMMLFGDDYLKFRPYLIENTFVYIRGRVQNRKFGNEIKEDEFEFKINMIDLLANARERFVKGINFTINPYKVNERFVDELELLIQKYKGKTRVKVTLMDHIEKIKIDMPSKGNGVDLSNELLEELEQLENLEFEFIF